MGSKKYHKIIKKINSKLWNGTFPKFHLDFSSLDDSELLVAVEDIRSELDIGRSSDYVLPRIFVIIREVFDRRLGIWKLFDAEPSIVSLRKTYNIVQEKRESIDDSQIHLDASFYKAVREIRQPGDGLTFCPYDVQLKGALALYEGKIAEMGTGEGKTVVAVFPACLWALMGKKVHIATVNDYLAQRDCRWMRPVFEFLGLKVDCVLSYMTDSERRRAYKADIVYGNNYEFGFDYLRDNVKRRLEDRVQGKLEYVIIDEIDSILMDEALTPLIISGAPEGYPGGYWKLKSAVELLLEKQHELVEQLFREVKATMGSYGGIIKLIQIEKADPWNEELLDYLSLHKDAVKHTQAVLGRFASARSEYKLEEDLFYVVDEKLHTVKLTERGMALVEQQLGEGFMTLDIADTPSVAGASHDMSIRQGEELRNFLQLLRAYVLFRRDEDYIVHDGGVVIVDEFTGRLAFGKKYEEGLHQAIECKEGLQITPENRVVGRITHPNYFRLYEKMVGMTATARTEAEEFKKLYKLEVARIPTNKPVIRIDLPDRFYRTEEEKLDAIIDEIEEHHSTGRPILVGTRSVEKSERLSVLLTSRGIPHNVLNAKNHAQEAEIIKHAGQLYAVTIATNMAGRGTDIALGDPDLGLHVIGTERHGARRIDDQLIGRSGRQGDPGSSRFFLSLQDDLFRVFKMWAAGGSENLTRSTRRAQRKSEEMCCELRKYVIERDDVTDKQRKIIYGMRQELLTGEGTKASLLIEDHVNDLINCGLYADASKPAYEWNLAELERYCLANFGVHIPGLETGITIEEIRKTMTEAFEDAYDKREKALGTDFSCKLARAAMLTALDAAWADYLSFQSEFDRALSLRSYVKSDTLTDYKLESSKSFEDVLISIRREALRGIFTYPLPEENIKAIRGTLEKFHQILSKEVKELLQA